ncbi:hypothetical protein EJB05_46835 [Eragrostis curvula]|uniref:HhH-GPD domain-containing protein n=1 Tax=Eragrostis curvula TaxID=38414 RepID=A0A5J9T5Y0_9POAL|nr:hypothetical protein EJB05_46835 [Eragrostis curvula]
MEGRKFPNRVASPPPVAEAIPPSVAPGKIGPPNLVIPAAAPSMIAEEEAMRQKKRKRRKQKEMEVPEPEIESPRPLPSETLCSEVDAAVSGKKQEENQAALMAEGEATRLKKRKRRKQKEQMEGPVVPSSSPCPPVTPEPKLKSRGPLAPESLSSVVDVAVRGKNQTAPSIMAEVEVTQLKKPKRRKQKEQVEVPVVPSPSPCPLVTLEPEIESPRPPPPETLCLKVDAAVSGKKQQQEESQAVAASPLLEPVDETVRKEEKKRRKRKKHEEGAASRSQSAVAGAPIVEGEHKTADAVALAPKQGKRELRRVMAQEQSSQSPLPFDIHPQGGEAAADGPKSESVPVRRGSSNRKRMRIETRKQQPLPKDILPLETIAADPNHSDPVAAFLNQFTYKSDRQQKRNSPTFPKTPDRPARLVPRGHSLSGPSKAARSRALNAPVSVSQETGPAKDKKKLVKRMAGKEQRKPKPLQLTAAEKRSDKYRRLPLDQLVPPPCSPHNLLQEKYASDPWKVIVICMLLNRTQGIQVRNILSKFFELYPDPQIAYRADPSEMAQHLVPLGLQKTKTRIIQKFSKGYVEKEWTHITQLCGVGKYAADAYAIFCAGRATEVVPEDHKLVDYWNYVCNELPLVQGSEYIDFSIVADFMSSNVHTMRSGNTQESGMSDELEKVAPNVQELAVCC